MSDLLPCPFCGSRNVKAERAFYDRSINWVACSDCNASGSDAVTTKLAVAAWNRRVKEVSHES
jgi:Lar family restriction alleviation protein